MLWDGYSKSTQDIYDDRAVTEKKERMKIICYHCYFNTFQKDEFKYNGRWTHNRCYRSDHLSYSTESKEF